MLKVEKEGQSAFLVMSDDANAENMALDEAVNQFAPHLHADFQAIELDDDGMLVWRVERSEWDSLMEVLEGIDGVNPDEADEAQEMVDMARKEPQT